MSTLQGTVTTQLRSNLLFCLELCQLGTALRSLRLACQSLALPRLEAARESDASKTASTVPRCTELASCKDTSKQPRFARPDCCATVLAKSHDSLSTSICARDSALQISSRRNAPRGSTFEPASHSAPRAQRDETPRAERAPPDARRSAPPPARARASATSETCPTPRNMTTAPTRSSTTIATKTKMMRGGR